VEDAPWSSSPHPDDPSVNVNVAMPTKTYDRLYVKARRERVSVPELIRRSLARDSREDDREK